MVVGHGGDDGAPRRRAQLIQLRARQSAQAARRGAFAGDKIDLENLPAGQAWEGKPHRVGTVALNGSPDASAIRLGCFGSRNGKHSVDSFSRRACLRPPARCGPHTEQSVAAAGGRLRAAPQNAKELRSPRATQKLPHSCYMLPTIAIHAIGCFGFSSLLQLNGNGVSDNRHSRHFTTVVAGNAAKSSQNVGSLSVQLPVVLRAF